MRGVRVRAVCVRRWAVGNGQSGVAKMPSIEVFDFDETMEFKNRAELEVALESLVEIFGEERIRLLAELVKDVKGQTGYGCVKVILAQGDVVGMKKENSYK